MKQGFIFGASGHAHVVASIIKNRYDKLFFIDVAPTQGNHINEDEFFKKIGNYKNHSIYLGIGVNKIRSRIYQKLIAHEITPSNCIADNAFIAHDAQLGNGIVICPGGVVGSKTIIGNNTIINTLSSVDHDCILGNNSQVSISVSLCGNVVVGENCFFGVKSAVVPNIKIGNNSIVMAGSLVHNDVQDDVMVGGIPARFVKKV